MKLLKILLIIVSIFFILNIFAYINLMTIEKYEVESIEIIYDLEGKKNSNKEIESKRNEIAEQKGNTKLRLVISSGLFLVLLSMFIYKKKQIIQ